MDGGTPDGWKPYRPPRTPVSAVSRTAPPPGEEELWSRWRAEGDLSARDALFGRYEGYARSLAARLYARRSFNDIQFQEYHQLAVMGLLEAIDRFEPGRGTLFKTFATLRIRGAVHNGLETLTERHQQFAMRRRLASERTASLVPEHMALGDPEKLLGQLGDLAVHVALSFILDGIGLGPDAREGLPGDAYAEAELSQVRRRLWKAVDGLAERERLVLELHYRQGRRFDEVARMFGLSKGRISQIHAQALARLRGALMRTGQCDVVF